MRESKFGRSMKLEGEQKYAREAIILVLRNRFAMEPLEDIESTLADLDDLETLKALLKSAVDCRSLAEFREQMPTASSHR